MPASRNNLAQCDNCRRILITLLVQEGRQEFCSEWCTHEWCAKQIDGVTTLNLQEVIDRVKLYMQALQSNQGIMASLSALIVAAHICWPGLTPKEMKLLVLQPALVPVDDADKTPPLPPRPTLFREWDGAQEAAEAVEAQPVEQASEKSAAVDVESEPASASQSHASPLAAEETAP